MLVQEKRSLLVSAVSLGKGRLKLGAQAMLAARNAVEPQLKLHAYLSAAPFETVSLVMMYGDHEDLNPEIGEVDHKHSELPVSVTLDTKKLSRLALPDLTAYFRLVMIEVLCDVAANFDLPFEFLDLLRKENADLTSSP
jgi:hypothetical protein